MQTQTSPAPSAARRRAAPRPRLPVWLQRALQLRKGPDTRDLPAIIAPAVAIAQDGDASAGGTTHAVRMLGHVCEDSESRSPTRFAALCRKRRWAGRRRFRLLTCVRRCRAERARTSLHRHGAGPRCSLACCCCAARPRGSPGWSAASRATAARAGPAARPIAAQRRPWCPRPRRRCRRPASRWMPRLMGLTRLQRLGQRRCQQRRCQ